jgi:hypothetical protein
MLCFRFVSTTSKKVNIVVGRLLNIAIKIGTFSLPVISDVNSTWLKCVMCKADNYTLFSVTSEA